MLTRAIIGYAEGVLPAEAIATLRGISLEAVVAELEEAGVASQVRSGQPLPRRRNSVAKAHARWIEILPDAMTPEFAAAFR